MNPHTYSFTAKTYVPPLPDFCAERNAVKISDIMIRLSDESEHISNKRLRDKSPMARSRAHGEPTQRIPIPGWWLAGYSKFIVPVDTKEERQ